MEQIRFWDRAAKREEIETVYGDALVRWLYGTPAGRGLADGVLSRRFLSQAYGAYQGSGLSRHKIEPFIRDFKIRMDEYEDSGFQSFNDFFIRKFKSGARRFADDPTRLPAFSEARYLAWESVKPEQTFPVKGAQLTPAGLLGSQEKAQPFVGGPLVIARLCPVDYHRYHYPDDGRTVDHYFVRGKFHSVNPMALRSRDDIFVTNERRVSILETRGFGTIAYIEVGAMCVGRIVQTHPEHKPFKRGDEKGYFLFGGSTVIVIGERGKWKPDADILEETARQRECFIRLGEAMGSST